MPALPPNATARPRPGTPPAASWADVALTASWDVWKHGRAAFEIYGTEGSMLVPDPNFFGGTPMASTRNGDWRALDIDGHPFGVPNRTLGSGQTVADYRIIGVLDMATAIRRNRPEALPTGKDEDVFVPAVAA